MGGIPLAGMISVRVKTGATSNEPFLSKIAGDMLMKYLAFALTILVASVLMSCGAGHPNLVSIKVSPQSAATTSNPQGQVGYTATGTFSDNTSRQLSQVDGLSWKTSTTAASIGPNGEATCMAPGMVTITANAPENLQITVNNGVQNTATNVTGTASLTCQ